MSTLNWIKKYFPFISTVLAIIFAVLVFNLWSSLKQERKDREFEQKMHAQNFNAMKDSITASFDKKLKAFIFEKDSYIVNELKDLKQYNKELERKLDKVKGDVIAAIDTKVSTKITDLSASNELVTIDLKKGLYGLNFESEYKDTGFESFIKGTSKFYANRDIEKNSWILTPDTTVFNEVSSSINITYGFRELKDKYEVFAVSPSPRITINQLDGVLILDKCPKKPVPSKKWGLSGFIGPCVNTQFDGDGPRFGWALGIGLTYDIIQW
jgi:hypothetical protein